MTFTKLEPLLEQQHQETYCVMNPADDCQSHPTRSQLRYRQHEIAGACPSKENSHCNQDSEIEAIEHAIVFAIKHINNLRSLPLDV